MIRNPTISAAIITLNEERRLPSLLAALNWADQVVIVDGGSTDDTVAIARRHGCRLAVHPFDSFARQRNRAIEMATGDWLLSIDADERPTKRLAAEIRTRIAQSRHAAFRVPIRSRIFGRPFRHSGTQDDRPIRLFRRGAARWEGEVHERLRLAQSAARVGQLRAWLEHDTLPDLASFLQKMDRYTTLEARQRVASGQSPRWRDRWLSPIVETARRMIWKRGLLDGPEGWAFCLLSGLSQWVLADKHRRWWRALHSRPLAESKCRHAVSAASPHELEPVAL